MKTNEIIIDLPGYDGKYKISNFGYIFRNVEYYDTSFRGRPIRRKLPFKKLGGTKKSRKGYARVNLNGKVNFIHRLIAQTFIENPNNLPQVNHKDGNKLNNHVDNLEWTSNQENRDHAVKNKLIAHGETCGQSKLTKAQVIEIKQLYSTGEYSQRALGEKFGVIQQTISKIVRNETWLLALMD